jgi:S-adenosylmethionine hydrolase
MPVRITLTTDFGTRDPYVAQLKAVLYAQGPSELEVVDLTHEIGPQNVREAALFIEAAWPRFPPGTIHIAVIDPGVGTARRALAVQRGTQYWLAPDNGVLSLVLDGSERAVAIEPQRLSGGSSISATFHGRDEFAPAAARLAHGLALAELGAPARDLIHCALPVPRASAGGIAGEVIHVDHFGNLVTNLNAQHLAAISSSRARARLQDGPALPIVRTYAEASAALFALLGSSQRLELAVTNGSAQALTGAGIGAIVWIGPDAGQ